MMHVEIDMMSTEYNMVLTLFVINNDTSINRCGRKCDWIAIINVKNIIVKLLLD